MLFSDIFSIILNVVHNTLDLTFTYEQTGYPYDNAPMERYFNTLKTDLIYNHSYKTENELYRAIEEYAYVVNVNLKMYKKANIKMYN